jgi:hypothetical protein
MSFPSLSDDYLVVSKRGTTTETAANIIHIFEIGMKGTLNIRLTKFQARVLGKLVSRVR